MEKTKINNQEHKFEKKKHSGSFQESHLGLVNITETWRDAKAFNFTNFKNSANKIVIQTIRHLC